MSILESFLAGKEARRVADAAEQINAMQSFIGQNGAAIMGGDQNALGQLAGFGAQGLEMAMGIQGDVQARERQEKLDAMAMEDRAYGRERDQKMDARADQEWEMQLAEYAKGLTAEQAAAEAAQMEEAAKMALTATSPEQWDRLATENGAPDLVGQFENREAVAARFMSISEVLKATQPPSGPEWRAATPEEAAAYGAAAGQFNTKTGEFKKTGEGAGFTQTITSPDGSSTTIQLGGGAGGGVTSATNTDVQKTKMAYDGIMAGLDEYERIFAKTGGALVPGADKDALLTARRGLQLQMKELFNLGVINGPDLAILDALLVDPTSISNNVMSYTGVAPLNERVKSNLSQVRTLLTQIMNAKAAITGAAPGSSSPPPAGGFDQSEIDQLMLGP